MLSRLSYLEIINNKEKWVILEGGISNSIYKYNNYVIKIINKQNNNLFVILSNYYKILEKLDTTTYIDSNDNIIIENYIEGNTISNKELFSKDFCFRIFDLIDNYILNLNFDIPKTNVIKIYVEKLSEYLKKNQIFENEYIKMYNIVLPKINKYFNSDNYELCFSHNDIHKYNIIISNNNILNLIDYEYSGYTWKYFDQSNFIVLLFNEAITNKINIITKHNINEYFNFDFYFDILIKKYPEYTKEYFLDMMIISAYTWYLWALVKYDLNKDLMYINYSNQIKFIIEHLLIFIH